MTNSRVPITSEWEALTNRRPPFSYSPLQTSGLDIYIGATLSSVHTEDHVPEYPGFTRVLNNKIDSLATLVPDPPSSNSTAS